MMAGAASKPDKKKAMEGRQANNGINDDESDISEDKRSIFNGIVFNFDEVHFIIFFFLAMPVACVIS